MRLSSPLLAIAVFASIAGAASAQSTVVLGDLDADRLNDRQIAIEFEYQGSACEKVEQAQLGQIVDGTLAVTFPTSSTAEMCTMQIVEIEVEQAIDADASVQRVEVTLLGTDGKVAATGTTQVDND